MIEFIYHRKTVNIHPKLNKNPIDVRHKMIPKSLPPVGQPISLASVTPLPCSPGYLPIWLNSGTAALALAFIFARTARPEVKAPQVILPAYGCPDLVAAAVHAGVQPVLVDIQEDDPSYDLSALAQAINGNVVAVVLVNFLGIRERVNEVVATVRSQSSKASIVEDNAQWFPEAEALPASLQADFVLTSFGRGKPVNLMGGGVLWCKDAFQSLLLQWQRQMGPASQPQAAGIGFRLKASVFNTLLRPPVYYWVSRLPFLKVGATEYHALECIEPMDAERCGQAGAAISRYLAADRWRESFYREHLARLPVVDLAGQLSARAGRMLRYPILLPADIDNSTLECLTSANVGLSRFYQKPLMHIQSVSSMAQLIGNNTAADKFARRLLTLPLHPGVSEKDALAVISVLEKHLI